MRLLREAAPYHLVVVGGSVQHDSNCQPASNLISTQMYPPPSVREFCAVVSLASASFHRHSRLTVAAIVRVSGVSSFIISPSTIRTGAWAIFILVTLPLCFRRCSHRRSGKLRRANSKHSSNISHASVARCACSASAWQSENETL